MLTKLSSPLFITYVSPFTSYCDSVIVAYPYLLSVCNDGSMRCVGETTVFSKAGDAFAIEASNVPMLDSGSSSNKYVSWSDFVVNVDKDSAKDYARRSSKSGTTDTSVTISKSKIPEKLENGKVWQPSSES